MKLRIENAWLRFVFLVSLARLHINVWLMCQWEKIVRFVWRYVVHPLYWKMVRHIEWLIEKDIAKNDDYVVVEIEYVDPEIVSDRYDGLNRHER